MKTNDIPLSLYIHTPWCLHKCPYCDFNSHQLTTPPPEEAYIAALIDDLTSQLSALQNRSIQSIFIGGGTPSLLSPSCYEHLFEKLYQLTTIDTNAEITLEANPGTVEQKRFQGYRRAGINRLSIGVQSFQNQKLTVLQRIHDANEAKHAIDTAYQAGFDNFNIDLMFGLPNQSIQDGLYDLQTAVDLQPTHLSWYQLTLEPHTAFYHRPPMLPNDDTIWDLQMQGQRLLASSGYQQYEISAYAKPNKQCQHNRNYWLFGDYIGIGAGAHGKITHFATQTIERRWNCKNPKDYLSRVSPTIARTHTLSNSKKVMENERPLEFMMNTLRLLEPIPLTLFEARTGLPTATIEKPLTIATQQAFLRCNKECIELTEKGRYYLNDLLALF